MTNLKWKNKSTTTVYTLGSQLVPALEHTEKKWVGIKKILKRWINLT